MSDAQESFRISRPELSYKDNILTIRYDITGCSSGELFNIKLIIISSGGDTLKPSFITGDFGKDVTCGAGKTIFWNLVSDNIAIDDELNVIVVGERSGPIPAVPTAEITERKARGPVVLPSLVVPGLGQKIASGKPCYLVFSGLVYGSAGTALIFTLRSNKLKEDYRAAAGQERDDLFAEWENSYKTARIFAAGAAGIWAANIIWSLAMPSGEKSKGRPNVSMTVQKKNELLICAKFTF